MQSSVGRPTKRQKTVSDDGATISPMSDAAATSQTAAQGVGRGSHPQKITLDDAIQQAKALLKWNSHSLKLAATTEPDLDTSDPFFLDGLGDLYDTDPSMKEKVVKLFQPGKSRVLYNTSGSGKTRLLVEGLCQYWGFYFTPEVAPHFGSADFYQAMKNIDSSADAGIPFTPQLQLLSSLNRRDAALQRNRKIAQIVFLSVLLARLLVFEAFLQAGVDIPVRELRRRWTYLQLVPLVLHSRFSSAETDIFASVYQTVNPSGDGNSLRVTNFIRALRQDPRMSTPPFFVVLDEAQIFSNQYKGAFHSESNKSSDGMRPVLREIFSTWGASLANTVVLFSGTGSSLTKVFEDRVSMATVNDSVITDTGAFVSKEQQAAYITRHVKLDENSQEEVLRRAWRWLRGRHCFTVEFVHVLQRCGTKNASALLTHYIKILTDYNPTDGSNDQAMTPEETGLFPELYKISQLFQKLVDTELLRGRVAAGLNNFMVRNKPHLVDSEDAETIEFGIARYTTTSEGVYKNIIIDEPLIVAGALKYFENSGGSVKRSLRVGIYNHPIGPVRGYDLKAIGMYLLGQQLDGTKSLRQIFDVQKESIDIGKGTAQLIALDEIDQDGKMRYSIVQKPWLWPFGMCFEASDPSEHERWFKGTGTGHDVGFFVLVDGKSIVFVMDQFKSLSKVLDVATTKRALESTSLTYCYKGKNGKVWQPGESARETILKVLEPSKVPCLGVLTSFPPNPHHRIINENAPGHFALFDISKGEGELERVLAGFKGNQFPDLGDIWEVEDDD